MVYSIVDAQIERLFLHPVHELVFPAQYWLVTGSAFVCGGWSMGLLDDLGLRIYVVHGRRVLCRDFT